MGAAVPSAGRAQRLARCTRSRYAPSRECTHELWPAPADRRRSLTTSATGLIGAEVWRLQLRRRGGSSGAIRQGTLCGSCGTPARDPAPRGRCLLRHRLPAFRTIARKKLQNPKNRPKSFWTDEASPTCRPPRSQAPLGNARAEAPLPSAFRLRASLRKRLEAELRIHRSQAELGNEIG